MTDKLKYMIQARLRSADFEARLKNIIQNGYTILVVDDRDNHIRGIHTTVEGVFGSYHNIGDMAHTKVGIINRKGYAVDFNTLKPTKLKLDFFLQ